MAFVGRGRTGGAADRDGDEIAAVLAHHHVSPGTGAEMRCVPVAVPPVCCPDLLLTRLLASPPRRRTLGDTLAALMVAGPSAVTAYYAVQAGSNLPPAAHGEHAV